MATAAQVVNISKKRIWAGRIISALPVAMMAFSAFLKLMHPPEVLQGFEHLGWPQSLVIKLGILEISCAVIYVLPRTSVLGAILVTGYLGGAVATHVRVLEPAFVGALILGVLAWIGLYLREPRLEALVPLRN